MLVSRGTCWRRKYTGWLQPPQLPPCTAGAEHIQARTERLLDGEFAACSAWLQT